MPDETTLETWITRIEAAANALVSACSDSSATRSPTCLPGIVEEARDRLIAELMSTGRLHPIDPGDDWVRSHMELADQPVFLTGVHKSGTTFLQQLLDGHPSLLIYPQDGHIGYESVRRRVSGNSQECWEWTLVPFLEHTLTPAMRIARKRGWALAEAVGDFRPYMQLVRVFFGMQRQIEPTVLSAYRTLALAMCATLPTEAQGAVRRWGYKSTVTIREAGTLAALFPRGQFVQIVRHPCAVAAAQVRKQVAKERLFDIYEELLGLRQGFRTGLEQRRLLGRERYCIVRYEDLVASTECQMMELAAWLGIEFDAVLTKPTEYGRDAVSNTAYAGAIPQAGRVSSGSLRKWQSELSVDESLLVQSFLGPEMRAFGYRDEVPVTALPGAALRVVGRYGRRLGVRPLSMARAAKLVVLRLTGGYRRISSPLEPSGVSW